MNALVWTTAMGVYAFQMPYTWHRGGMFVGMHWIWWSLWLLTICVLLWALWRLFRERSEIHRRVERQEAAEEALRMRFAAGEIDEEEYARRMRVLRETTAGEG